MSSPSASPTAVRQTSALRVVAILAVYNEERFVGACLEHLARHGVETYLIDNESTDRTVALAETYRGRGLVGIETFPRHGFYSWRPLLERKEALASLLEADWFLHVDADEIRLPPPGRPTLIDALTEAEARGFNAVNFLEFTFVPTREAPDHDHPHFQGTMRWYYPFLPAFPNRLNAWRRQPERVELAWSGGHQVRFPGLRMYPESFPMRHYLFLSVPHAIDKYIGRRYDPHEVAAGWHRARVRLRPELIRLPSQRELRPYRGDDLLDPTSPRTRHYLFDEAWAASECPGPNAP